MHCDAQPIWCVSSRKIISQNLIMQNRVRFLGYAGVSVAVSIPCFFVAAFTAWKLIRAHKDVQRSHRHYGNVSNRFSLDPLSQGVPPLGYKEPPDYQVDIHPDPSPATSPALLMSPLRASNRTAFSSDVSSRKFRLASGASPVLQAWVPPSHSATAKTDDLYEPDTPTSSTFPRFASPSRISSLNGPWPAYPAKDDHLEMQDEFGHNDGVSSLRWARDNDLASMTTEEEKELDEHHFSSSRLNRNGKHCRPSRINLRLIVTCSSASTICVSFIVEFNPGDLATCFLSSVWRRPMSFSGH